ncbi:hypothetical protein [Ornithinimicrobium sp. CNJ-824]
MAEQHRTTPGPRTCAARGESWSEDQEIVLERFAVVWPPEHADP